MLWGFAISDLHAFYIQKVASCETLAYVIWCYLLPLWALSRSQYEIQASIQLVSPFEDSFSWCQTCEDHISIGIGG